MKDSPSLREAPRSQGYTLQNVLHGAFHVFVVYDLTIICRRGVNPHGTQTENALDGRNFSRAGAGTELPQPPPNGSPWELWGKAGSTHGCAPETSGAQSATPRGVHMIISWFCHIEGGVAQRNSVKQNVWLQRLSDKPNKRKRLALAKRKYKTQGK